MTALGNTELLIVGAGPFGLAMAAQARHLGIDHVIVGQPMGFWKTHMPKDMYLRSACDWHLDPEDEDTIEAFLRERNLTPADVEPLSLDRYLEYAAWFQCRKQIAPWPVFVERLDAPGNGNGRFHATLTGGETIAAKSVVLAIGFEHFKNVPRELEQLLPADRVQHTCDFVDFSSVRGQRWLIVGGRQSAFEWAALMAEAGALAVHVSLRHDVPAFAESEWSWVKPLVDGMVDNPGWYRGLTDAEKDAIGHRLWAEGRLKLEPWLASRLQRTSITLWPNTRVAECRPCADGRLDVTLAADGRTETIDIDRVVLATGYKVDVTRVPLLVRGNVLARLRLEHDAPVLDEHLQTTVPGLFMTSMPATRHFGPFFAFTVAVRASAKLIGRALRRS